MNEAEPVAPETEPTQPAPVYLPAATAETVAGARPWIPLLFLLSGAAGLVYEVLWSKYLGFVLGNAAYANALVLATFLGGLALGAALIGRQADKVPNQLYLYAWLELGVALFAGLTPSAFTTLEAIVGQTGPIGRVLMAVCVLVPPTLLMGGSLPALSRFLTRDVGGLQSQVARLYFLNSAGAVVGTLLAGFLLIPRYGLDGAVYLAAFVNVGIGVLALHLSKQGLVAVDAPAPAIPAEPEAPEVETPVATWVYRYVIAAVFVSGFVALAYEVAWIRLLALVLGSSTYSFTLMLSAFVAGIALGSLCVERGLVLGRTALGRFALAEALVAIGVLVTLPLYDRLPYWFLQFKATLAATSAGYPLYEAGKFAFCFLLMLVPTVFLGMTLPLATRLVTARRSEVGARVGEVFAANTLGNVLGAVAATLWLLPWLGIKGLIDFGVLVNLLVAAGALWLMPGLPAVRRIALTALPFLLFTVQRIASPGFDMQVLASGVFRESAKDLPASWADFKLKYADRRVLYNRDDANTTVTITKVDENIFMSLNGKVDASSEGDLATQIYSAQLPLLLRPQAKDVLVIGFGSGITAGSALTHPLASLDLAEISPAVLEAGEYFAPYNHDVQKDPRFHAHAEDGLSLLRRPGSPYDLIITEPSNSWMAGVGNLFTLDAYQLMANRLAPDGLAVQWLPLYETDDETLGLILHSFTAVFPYATLWQTQAMDTIIIGSRTPFKPDFKALAARAALPAVQADLARTGLSRPASLLMLQLATPRIVDSLAKAGSLNTLRRPRLEYHAPVAFYADETAMSPYQADHRLTLGSGNDHTDFLSGWLRSTGKPLGAEDFASYVAYQTESLPLNALKGVDAQILRAWREAYPHDARAIMAEAKRFADKGQVADAITAIAPLVAARPTDPQLATFWAKLQYAHAIGGYGWLSTRPAAVFTAIQAHERLLKMKDTDRALLWSRLAALKHAAGDRPGEYAAVRQAVAAYDEQPRASADQSKLRLQVAAGETALEARDFGEARRFFEAAWALDQSDLALRRAVARYDALTAPAKP